MASLRTWLKRRSALTSPLRDARLPRGDRRRGDQGDEHQRGGRDAPGVPVDEPSGPIAQRVLSGRDRPSFEVAANVFGEVLDRRVAALGFLAQRLQHDRIELAAELAASLDGGGDAGPHGRLFADRPRQVRVAAPLRAVGALSRQQPVQQHAQGIDVARDRHRLAADLLRARRLQRERAVAGPRLVSRREARLEQLGDAEVQELRRAVRRDQDVARLEVPVDDEVLMGVLDGRAHLAEQHEPWLERERPRLAVGVEGNALDALHHDVGHAILGGPAVQQPRDVGMIQGRQDAPLLEEPLHQRAARRSAAHDLDRHLLLEGGIGALREVHHGHPALSQLPDDPVGPDRSARDGRRGALERRRGDRLRGAAGHDRRGFQEVAGSGVRAQEGFHLAAQRLVPRAGLRQPGRTLGVGALQRIGGDLLHPQPAFGAHAGGLIRQQRRPSARGTATPWRPPTRA